MKVHSTEIPDVLVLQPNIFEDDRGLFFESFNQGRFEEAAKGRVTFVQDNHSVSRKGVVRGLHYQLRPKAQGKLVRVVHGEIFDVAVDIRRDSPSFGQVVTEVLSAENRKQLWIPEGFLHGFQALSETAEVLYKTTDCWSPAHERSVQWNDPAIGISWPDCVGARLSPKDAAGKLLAEAELF